jgi:hypothetical protein
MSRVPVAPYPFPQRSLEPVTQHNNHPSQTLLYSKNYIFNPFLLTHKSPTLRFLPFPSFGSSLTPEQQSHHSTLQSTSSFSSESQHVTQENFIESRTGQEFVTSVDEEMATGATEEPDYEYSLELNPVWIDRLANTMRRIKKKKKKRSGY